MKKLISAATSIAMAATIVGAAVPFTSGAAVEGKTLELRPFNGASATISADAIAAGDVTIPVGLYVVEKSADSQTISAQFTIKTSDGDASGILFGDKDEDGKYMALEPKSALPEAIDYKFTDGSTINYDKLITFAGEMKTSKGKPNFSYANGSQVYDIANEGYTKANTKNAFSSCAWTAPQGGYTWTDAGASDTFPIYVVNVTFPKGTKNGTYTMDFCDYAKNADVMSNLIEVGTTKLDTKQGGLTLKGLDIKVGDASAPASTTAPATQAPTQPATEAPKTDAPATQPATQAPSEGSVIAQQGQKDFVVKPGTYTVSDDTDKNYVEVMVESGSHKVGLQAVKLDTSKLPKGITFDEPEEESESTGKSWKESNGQYILETLKGGDTVALDDTKSIMSIHFNVDKSVPDGKYEFTFSRWHVAEKSDTEFDATIEKGYIIVGNGGATVETTTAPATEAPKTTTIADKTTEPATTTKVVVVPTTTDATPSNVVYGDVNCDGKVNIADTVILSKWLTASDSINITAQGLLNADCCDPTGNAKPDTTDSDAILKAIVHNVTLPCKAADVK